MKIFSFTVHQRTKFFSMLDCFIVIIISRESGSGTSLKEGSYSPSHTRNLTIGLNHTLWAEAYAWNRSQLSNTVKHLFLDYQWSPEEIEGCGLRLEYGKTVISYQTIYRAIYRGHFDDNSLSHGARRSFCKLRHRGKIRHTKGYVEKIEGKFLFLIRFTKDQKMLITELE